MARFSILPVAILSSRELHLSFGTRLRLHQAPLSPWSRSPASYISLSLNHFAKPARLVLTAKSQRRARSIYTLGLGGSHALEPSSALRLIPMG